MIAYGHALVVGAHDDVEQIALAFLIAIADALELIALDEMERQLAVVVAQLGVLAVERCPRGILIDDLAAGEVHVGREHGGAVAGHAHGLLHEVVVDGKAEVAVGELTTLIADGIA